MGHPTVLHCARDWLRPSEGFVYDVVRSTSATRPAVACHRRWPGAPAGEFPVHEVGRLAERLPSSSRRATHLVLVGVAVAERAALLHAHFGYWAAPVQRVARALRRPWLVSLHGHDVLAEARRDPAQLALLRKAPLVVVPSRFLADKVAELGFRVESLRVIPAGVELAALPFRERRPRDDGVVTVTVAGRYVEKKGVLDAARALAQVTARWPRLAVVFVGHGPLEAELRALLGQLELPAELLDGARPGALRAALRRTDLAMVASRTAADGDAETLGLVAIEAQALGVPLVATRHGGLVEAVDPDAGLLVGEGNVAGLAAATEALLSSPQQWSTMGRAGRRHVEAHFDLATRTGELEENYLALLGRSRWGRSGQGRRGR